jgi:hypothetical protein
MSSSAGDEREVVLHPVIEFLEEQVAFGDLAVALGAGAR